jgi:hypothetical protein
MTKKVIFVLVLTCCDFFVICVLMLLCTNAATGKKQQMFREIRLTQDAAACSLQGARPSAFRGPAPVSLTPNRFMSLASTTDLTGMDEGSAMHASSASSGTQQQLMLATSSTGKRPYDSVSPGLSTLSSHGPPSSSFACSGTKIKAKRQIKIFQGAADPVATMEMDFAIADMIHSNLLPFSFSTNPKFKRVLEIARRLPRNYSPPNRNRIGGELLEHLYLANWKRESDTLLLEARCFGISLFGDGATIKTVPMVNALGAGAHNQFAMLDVFDCSEHCSNGGKKDATYIANLFLPIIKKLENMTDVHVSLLFVFFLFLGIASSSPTVSLLSLILHRVLRIPELLILSSLTEQAMFRMPVRFWPGDILALQLAMVLSMSSHYSLRMSSNKYLHSML